MSIHIITGAYGCGKTNYAINLAVRLKSSGNDVTLIDFDTVNPYYRSFDFKSFLKQHGISLIAPVFAGTNLDLPAVTGEISAVLQNNENVIIDVGGDDAGAVVLGGYSETIKNREYESVYLINPYRAQTATVKEAFEVMRNIEISSKIPITVAVGNPNLGENTTADDIYEALPELLGFSDLSGIPITSVLAEENLFCKLSPEKIPIPICPITVYTGGGVYANYSRQSKNKGTNVR